MKVYTRGGDTGETSLFGGERVRKDHLRVEAYGAVDELNATLGLAAAELAPAEGVADVVAQLTRIQSSLFDLGGELATPDFEARAGKGRGLPRIDAADVDALEQWIDTFDEELRPLENFVLPGGTRAAAALHLARTICRRAERRAVALAEHDEVAELPIRYLNRLSDYLFTLARVANARAGHDEPLWVGRER